MIFNQNRQALRQMYRDAWERFGQNRPLTALESQIVDVLQRHPEYHQSIRNTPDKDYTPEAGETNPYMHMSLHLAVRDQLQTNRPTGITALFEQLLQKCADRHAAEHILCERMGEELWQAQRDARMPDEQRYLGLVNAFLLKMQ